MQHIEDFEAMMKHVWCYVAEDARLGVWPQSGLRGEAGLQEAAGRQRAHRGPHLGRGGGDGGSAANRSIGSSTGCTITEKAPSPG